MEMETMKKDNETTKQRPLPQADQAKPSARFFKNTDCEHYPCHGTGNGLNGGLNCLFCYCPLYHIDDCPGAPAYAGHKHKIKDCSGCGFPHRPENYEAVLGIMLKAMRE